MKIINQLRRLVGRCLYACQAFLARCLYPKDDVRCYIEQYRISPGYIVRTGFFQKILGFNRHVPWPVHFTSHVSGVERIGRPRGHSPFGWSPTCYIQAINGIRSGRGVYIGPGVTIISANHKMDDLTSHVKSSPIVIEDDCWIGANAVILPGIHLGPRTIVGAAAVVTKSFPKGGVVIGGNPARILRELSPAERQTITMTDG